jgi:hypothetical protein
MVISLSLTPGAAPDCARDSAALAAIAKSIRADKKILACVDAFIGGSVNAIGKRGPNREFPAAQAGKR